MPNNLDNLLRIRGDVAQFIVAAKGLPQTYGPVFPPNEEVFCFHALYPVPVDVLSKPYKDEGYYWENSHWGCKWGGYESEIVSQKANEVVYKFTTAWSAPLAFLDKIAKDWPTLRFFLSCLDYDRALVLFQNWRNGKARKDRLITGIERHLLPKMTNQIFRV